MLFPVRSRRSRSRAMQDNLGLLGLTLLLGCSSGGAPPPAPESTSPADKIAAVPFASTAMLSADDLTSLQSDDVSGKLTFATAPASLAHAKRGTILVAGQSPTTPHGLLRVVRTVERDGTALTLTTVHAPIQLAFQSLHLQLAKRSSGELADVLAAKSTPGTKVGALGGTASKTVTQQIVLFDGDGDEKTEDDRAVLDMAIGGTVEYDLSLDFEWDAIKNLPEVVDNCVLGWLDFLDSGEAPDCSFDALLPEAKASFDVVAHLTASAKLSGAAKADFEKDFPIFPPETLAEIPLGPIVIAPVLQIDGKVEGGASAEFSVGVHAQGDIATGVDVSSKHLGAPTLREPDVKNVDFQPDAPKASLAAHAKASVSASLTATLFNVTGPYATLGLFAALDASTDKDPCWSAHAGIETSLGLRVVPSLPFIGAVTLFDWSAPPFEAGDIDIAHGSCLHDPNASTLPPGSGADANHYAKPTFTPWSMAYAAPADADSVLAPTGDATDWTDLKPSIDGRFVVAGAESQTLFKIAESGALVWARQYPLADNPDLPYVLRVANTGDAALLVATHVSGAPGIALLKINQSGEALWHEKLTLGDGQVCNPYTQAIASAGGNFSWVAGGCVEQGQGWILRVSEQGVVSDFWTFKDPLGAPIAVTTLVVVDGEAVIAGSTLPAGGLDSAMFAVRFSPTGQVRFARTFGGCTLSPDLSPTTGVAGKNGDVTLAGSSGGHHNAFIARIKADGSVGWQAFPNVGLGLSRVLVLNSIAELPTTGYVAAGSTNDVTAEGVENTPSIAVAGFDGAGGVLWSKRYTLLAAAPGKLLASAFAGVQLTDDGGALVASLAQGESGAIGQIWAMKLFAKNGEIALDPAKAVSNDLGLKNLECALSAAPWSIVTGSGAFHLEQLATTTKVVELQTTSQGNAGK